MAEIDMYPALEQLQRQYDEGRLAHTLLIHGKPGWGTLDCAMRLSSYILAKAKAQNSLFGGSPEPASQEIIWEHPDLHFSFPFINTSSQGGSISDDFLMTWKSYIKEHIFSTDLDWLHHLSGELSGERKNPKGNINKAECNNILSKLSLKAFGENPKILIIWYPEYLAKEGNRLLKTLEEPSDDTYIILVASSTQQILGTILSRCQSVQMQPLTDEKISVSLADKVSGMTTERKTEILRRSQGDLGRALELAQDPESQGSATVLAWLRYCYQNRAAELWSFAEDFARMSKDGQVQWLESALFFLQQMHRYHLDPSYQLLMGAEDASAAQKMSKIVSVTIIDEMSRILEESIRQIRGNINAKIMMTDNSLLIHEVLRTGSVPAYAYT